MSETKLISGLPRSVANASPPLEATKGESPAVAASQLTPVQAAVLDFIRKRPDKSRHEVSRALGLSLDAVNSSIRELEKLELIERREDWS